MAQLTQAAEKSLNGIYFPKIIIDPPKRIMTPPKTIIGYHYTNNRAFESMKTPGIDGYVTDLDDIAGILPRRRFVRLGRGENLPDEAYEGVIEGLLEPEPKFWLENPDFPYFWRYLMHDICREREVVLLSFELRPEDKAYVVDRAHVERALYYGPEDRKRSKKEILGAAVKKYWDSRIPMFEYSGGYCAPQLAIWSGIEFERLKVEWRKPTGEVWQRVLDNDW